MSSLTSHSAVSVDVVSPVASQPLIEFCKNSSVSHCLSFFIINFYNGV